MRVLVSGGTGFIGSHLVKRLVEQGVEVVVPVRNGSNLQYLPVNHSVIKIETNLCDFEHARSLMNGIETAYHLASIRGRGWSVDDNEFYRVNVEITENLLKAAAAKRLKHFVYVSSVSVYGHAHGGPISTIYPISPATRYGWTKYYSEQLVKEYHQQENLQATIIRPVITYGPRDTWGMIPKLINLINVRRYITIGDGMNRVHLIYIDDLIDGMMLAAGSQTQGLEIYTLAGLEAITINDLVKIIASLLEKKPVNIHVPLWMGRFAGNTMERIYRLFSFSKEPIITRDKVDIMCRDRFFDIQNAKDKLGYSPQVGYESGLRKTVQWLKKKNIPMGGHHEIHDHHPNIQ